MVGPRNQLRIGIVDQVSAGWMGATSYLRMLVESLSRACETNDDELFVLTRRDPDSFANRRRLRVIRLTSAPCLPGENWVRRILRMPEKSQPLRGEIRMRHLLNLTDPSDLFLSARRLEIDVLLPLMDVPAWEPPVKIIGWVPDFQHFKLPELFSESERKHRDRAIRRLTENAKYIILSSNTARDHFVDFAPAHSAKARVVPFPSLLAFDPPSGDTGATLTQFNLPRKFALVTNQFWTHKNHLAVVEALGHLAKRGMRIPTVMTGLPADYRDPANETLSRLLQSIAAANLSGQVIVLGHVKYADLVNLIRTAAVIIQPSRFEGWNTTVQDAKALGRPLLCSDLPVHREQAQASLGFFPCDRPDVLAELLSKFWNELEPGPDYQLELGTLAAESEFATRHGRTLINLCREAVT